MVEKMKYYRLRLNPDLPSHVAASVETRFRGPGLVILAQSEQKAREWAAGTTGVAVVRGPDGLIPRNAWLDDIASHCVPIQGPIPKPTCIVAGVDIAEHHLDEDQREEGPEGERIVWWPCSPHDKLT